MFKSNGHPSPKYKSEPIPQTPYRGPQQPPQRESANRCSPPQAPGAGDVMPRYASDNNRVNDIKQRPGKGGGLSNLSSPRKR